jgi:hypothetical protein
VTPLEHLRAIDQALSDSQRPVARQHADQLAQLISDGVAQPDWREYPRAMRYYRFFYPALSWQNLCNAIALESAYSQHLDRGLCAKHAILKARNPRQLWFFLMRRIGAKITDFDGIFFD